MNVVIFTDFHVKTLGGISTSIAAQYKGLKEAGHNVTIISPRPVKPVEEAGHSIIELPIMPFIQPSGYGFCLPTRKNIRQINKVLDKIGKIDVIHLQSHHAVGTMGMHIARKRNIPTVQTIHGRDDRQAEMFYPLPAITTSLIAGIHGRFIPHRTKSSEINKSGAAKNTWSVVVNQAEQATVVTVPSNHFRDLCTSQGVTSQIEVVPNGLDDRLLKKWPNPPIRKLNSDRPLKIMLCGRLSPEKRPLVALAAAREIPDCTLDIYGSGPAKKKLQKFINKHGLGGRVKIIGQRTQEEVIEAMLDYDCLMFTSHDFDTQALVLYEATLTGLPAIYCDPNLSESMPMGGGILTSSPLVHGFTEVVKSIQENPSQLSRCSQAMIGGREMVRQSHKTDLMLSVYEKAIKISGAK